MSLAGTLDRLAAGASPWKLACRAVALSDLTLLGLQTIDGVDLDEGDRVLVAGQSDARQNGIYVARSGGWTRSIDMDRNTYVRAGTTVVILEGSQAFTTYTLTTPTAGDFRLGATELVWLGSALGLPSPADTSLSLPLVITGRRRVTISSGDVVLQLAAEGHTDGGYLEVVIEPGVDSIVYAPALVANRYGVDIDPAEGGVVIIQYTAGAFSAMCLALTDLVDDEPNYDSISAYSGATSVSLEFSEPVVLTSTSGLSIEFSAGTPRAFTGAISGQGTATIVVELDGAVDAGSSIEITLATGAAADLHGNPVPPGVHSADVAFALSSLAHRWRASDSTLNGSDVASVADSSGSAYAANLVQGTPGNQPAYTASSATFNDQPTITHAAGDDEFLAASRTSFDASAYTIMWIGRLLDSGVAATSLVSAALGTADPNGGLFLGHDTSAGGRLVWNAGDTGGTNTRTYAYALTTPVCLVARVDGTRLDLWVNGVQVATVTATFNPTSLDNIIIGKLTNAAAYYGRFEWAETQIAHEWVDDAEIAEAQTYAENVYGL